MCYILTHEAKENNSTHIISCLNRIMLFDVQVYVNILFMANGSYEMFIFVLHFSYYNTLNVHQQNSCLILQKKMNELI